MTLTFRRRDRAPADPPAAAELAASTRAEVDRTRQLGKLRREQAAADRAAELAEERARYALRAERRARRADAWRRGTSRARLLAPLLIVNAAAVYGQIAYAYASIAPAGWQPAARLALAVMFAAAVESVAVYVGWHAHDALLSGATATAARLRRASYALAAIVGAINYQHFAGEHMAPTAAAVAFGLLSCLSPWLWGLHTRRAQHVQLVSQGVVDSIGAVFSAERIRAFPLRSWAARRWSIDHGVSDPAAAWAGYNADRAARRRAYPAGRVGTAWAALRGALPAPVESTPPPAPISAPRPPVARVQLNPAMIEKTRVRPAEPVERTAAPAADDGAPVELVTLSKSAAVAYASDRLGPAAPASDVVAWLADRGVAVSESLVYKARRVGTAEQAAPTSPAPAGAATRINGHASALVG